MDIAAIKDWLVPVSTFVTLITASIAGWNALKEYRLKVQAETRLAKSSELESDIKLLKLFTEIMNIAHARGNSHISEKAIEKLLSLDVMKELGISTSNLGQVLNASIIIHPVGVAAQDAAIAAIWALGEKHEILRPVAIQALKSLTGFKSVVAQPYLQDLQARYAPRVAAAAEHP